MRGPLNNRAERDKAITIASLDQIRSTMRDIVASDPDSYTGLLDRLSPDDGSDFLPLDEFEARTVCLLAFLALTDVLINVADAMAAEVG